MSEHEMKVPLTLALETAKDLMCERDDIIKMATGREIEYRHQIAQLTKERDQLRSELGDTEEAHIDLSKTCAGLIDRAEAAEKERDQLAAKCCAKDHALKLVTICPTCEGSKVFALECPACLGGQPGRCTCAEQEAEPCPECEGSGRLFSGVVEEALSDQCGEGWLSPEKKKVLMNILKDLADGNFPGTPLNNGSSAMRLVEQALEACK